MVGPVGEDAPLRPARGVEIPRSLIRWRLDTPGGPGGQHANRAATRAEASLVLTDLYALGIDPELIARWRRRLGEVVRAVAADTRSQHRNKIAACRRLEDQLAASLRTAPPRRPTRPTRGSTRRRLEAKRRTAERKQTRRRPRRDGID